MFNAARYIRVPPDERVSVPVEDRRVAVVADLRVQSVSSDGAYNPPFFVVPVSIDAGGPVTNVFVMIDAGGPTSTYPLIDFNY